METGSGNELDAGNMHGDSDLCMSKIPLSRPSDWTPFKSCISTHLLYVGLYYVRVLLRNGMCVYQCMYVNLYQSYHTTN
jgi:hypothetical protein